MASTARAAFENLFFVELHILRTLRKLISGWTITCVLYVAFAEGHCLLVFSSSFPPLSSFSIGWTCCPYLPFTDIFSCEDLRFYVWIWLLINCKVHKAQCCNGQFAVLDCVSACIFGRGVISFLTDLIETSFQLSLVSAIKTSLRRQSHLSSILLVKLDF